MKAAVTPGCRRRHAFLGTSFGEASFPNEERYPIGGSFLKIGGVLSFDGNGIGALRQRFTVRLTDGVRGGYHTDCMHGAETVSEHKKVLNVMVYGSSISRGDIRNGCAVGGDAFMIQRGFLLQHAVLELVFGMAGGIGVKNLNGIPVFAESVF